MKFSLLILPALSAVALAAPAPPDLLDKSCAHKKPWKHYPDDWHGCEEYNKDELAYKVKCIWYKPNPKDCKPYWKKHEEVSLSSILRFPESISMAQGLFAYFGPIKNEPKLTSF